MSKDETGSVENPFLHEEVGTARNLPDAANADNSIQGYAAINGLDEHSEIAALAYELYSQGGEDRSNADDDWLRAEQEVRRRRDSKLTYA